MPASMIGLRIGEMEGFGGETDRPALTAPLAPFPSRHDAGDDSSPGERRAAAERLEVATADVRRRLELRDGPGEEPLAEPAETAALGEPFVIMGWRRGLGRRGRRATAPGKARPCGEDARN
ncbi:hypothetical protein [Paludisphaera borealis]|uniref:Uncharacterized protein n=1 Tax=Paludisphaera borealis TaxID=1387353 RepID=A0A1U7CWA9_9BACT|nr:hypothetical protein [Paludisphaera borealis]APW63232.1 hypothetical protein BSF38_04796 [Paludisphaera borealis]MDR3619239.1 hypothetical protein [Paludisphaera borealis]